MILTTQVYELCDGDPKEHLDKDGTMVGDWSFIHKDTKKEVFFTCRTRFLGPNLGYNECVVVGSSLTGSP